MVRAGMKLRSVAPETDANATRITKRRVVGSTLLSGEFFSGRGDFSLGVNMGSDSNPKKSLSDESVNRGLVGAHTHSIA